MKTALITGGGGGTAIPLARRLVAGGWRVISGLREGAGLPIATPNWRSIPLDVTRPEQIDAAVAELRDHGGLDALVHCAGIDRAGSFEDLSMAAWRELMEVNFFGAVALTRAVLPMMRERRAGRVIALSSLSGLVGLPGNSAYAASKFAMEGAFESLHHEVAPWGIEVALIEPSAYATGMAGRYRAADGVDANSPYAPLVEHCLASRAREDRGADPAELVALIVGLLEHGCTQLRYAAGAQAVGVAARLKAQDQAERAEFVAEVSGRAEWAPLLKSGR